MNNSFDTPQPSESVDLRQYLYLFWQWAWLIALAAVLAGGAAYLVNKRTTPVYQAATQLLVSAYQGVSSSDTIVTGYLAATTYVEMLTDRPVLEQTIAELKLAMTPDALKGAVHVSLATNTQIIMVTVEDTDPARAANIANTLGTVFSRRIQELQGARYAVTKADLQKQIDDMEAQIVLANTTLTYTVLQDERARLETKLIQFRTIYASLVTSFEQVRLAEAQTNSTVVQVDPAVEPRSPVRPNTRQNTLLAAVVGAMLAAGLVFAYDALDDTLKDPEEIARQTGLTVIGVIPHSEPEEEGPVTQRQPRSPVSEAYRALRTNIQYANAAHPIRRLAITSVAPADGKTTIAANLAVVLAQGGLNVTLIDADLRRPRVHHILNLANRAGLTSLFLQPQVNLNGSLQTTAVQNLSAVCSGQLPPNPAELLGSGRMGEVLEAIQQSADIILLDTPPCLSVTDAATLTPVVDGFVMVVKAGSTKVSAIIHAVTQLHQLGANLIGLVVNDVQFNHLRYGYYYRNHYDYNYSSRPDGRKTRRLKLHKSRKPEADLVVSTQDPQDQAHSEIEKN